MEKLYGPEEERLSRPGKEESGDEEEEWMTFDEGLFLAAARRLYEGERVDADFLRGDEARALTAETARVLRGAVRGSVRQETPAGLTAALESDAFEFSGLKTYHSLKEAGLSLTDERGDVRPFEDFMEDVLAVSGRYNRNWLRSEYNHAVGASQMAVRWNDFDKDSGRYDLQYRTAKDSLVRPDHAALDGITLPASDPFWNLYLPPNGWNCRCTAAEVRRGKYDRSDPDRSMRLGDEATDAPGMRMFRFNPGKSLRLFPPKHPYHKAPEEIKEAVRGMAEEEAKKRKEYERLKADPAYTDVELDPKSGGLKATHVRHNFDRHKGQYEKAVQDTGFKAGHAVVFGEETGNRFGEKYTEGTWDGLQFEISSRETGTSNNIKRGLEHCADKRDTEIAVLYFPNGDFDPGNFGNALRRYNGLEKLDDGQYVKFKKIICIQDGKIVHEEEP